MKQTLGAFSYELLQLMFALPYLKIELLERKPLPTGKQHLLG